MCKTDRGSFHSDLLNPIPAPSGRRAPFLVASIKWISNLCTTPLSSLVFSPS